ncbi:DoxX family protein [Frateuria hangzhouensis]|uniref:DoxX family protein n=1 Tax=Frateuria hangzhouensis TaxID=2995589 RepID=UPI002260CB56|nr:DoxX family protein [Frateuria sp. STR12]MCX7513055.1 DoxX family protein [Frateuria sp. STR12]
MNALLPLLGRLGLASIFILSGWGKMAGYSATQGYMEAMGVPGMLLPLVILLELGGGLAILAGVFTRWVAFALAGFSIVAALVFHANLGDQVQQIMFLKNFAIAGGFLMLAAHGPGALSIEARLADRRRTPAY